MGADEKRKKAQTTAVARTRTHDGGLPVKEVVAHGACGAVGGRVPSYGVCEEKEGEEEKEGGKEGREKKER